MATIDVDTITEDEAISLYHKFSEKFGWAGTFFTREDAEVSWNERYNQEGAMPKEAWEATADSYYWRKGLGDLLCEWGWDLVHQAVGEAVPES